jgi:hypothetical protein
MSVPEPAPEVVALYRRPVLQLQYESTAKYSANSLAYSVGTTPGQSGSSERLESVLRYQAPLFGAANY